VKTKVMIWLATAFIMEAGAFPQGGSCLVPGPAPARAGTDQVTDIDGNVYSTVQIGDQVWMGENLRTTRFNNGDEIPLVTVNAEWKVLSTPAYCWYQNNQAGYGAVYGALYNWYAVDSVSNGHRSLCPVGWHIPTAAEWSILTNYLGGLGVAGGKLKESGTAHWLAPNTGATNASGFSGLPGGYRGYVSGACDNLGMFGHWWSSTSADTDLAWGEGLFFLDNPANHSTSAKKNGFSIRCLKDSVSAVADPATAGPVGALNATPNPFNAQVEISFYCDNPGVVEVEIYDVRGRPVVELYRGYLEAGRRDFVWDGRDSHGRECPSARYLVRVKNGDRADTRSITLVK
jgi:uncharacterized protein (TIGR02145 family)